MKKYWPFLFCLLFAFAPAEKAASQQQFSQAITRCGTADYYEKVLQTNPDFKKKWEANRKQLYQNRILSTGRVADLADTITLVVHVVASAEIQQLVTDAIIQSQIDVLNEDYQGQNADSVLIPAHFKPLWGKSRLSFQLAGTTSLGEPTRGIVRTLTNDSYTLNTFENAKFSASGGSDGWDPSRYLNIWIVSFGNTRILGVSVIPGDPRPLAYHGFVCDYRTFGRGASHLLPQYNKGRTTTHELGHFFNLYHTWGDDGGSCTGTDFPDDVNDDTPNQGDATYGNPDVLQTGMIKTDNCSPASPGIMYQNFMDYTDDAAMALFTRGQQNRIEQALAASPDRSSLLFSTAYIKAPAYRYDTRIRSILAPGPALCETSFRPEVILRNSGSSTLTSVRIVSTVNQEAPVVYQWTGTLLPYTESKVDLPGLTAKGGRNTLSVFTDLPNGTEDENRSNDTATFVFDVFLPVTLTSRFHENFSTQQFPPPDWWLVNPGSDRTWEKNASFGANEVGSAWINGWSSVSAQYDDLVSPNFTYRNIDSIFLYFNLAAAGFDAAHLSSGSDTLSVLVSKDCGHTFTTVYKKWGQDIQTISNNAGLPGEFLPLASQWRRDSVNLGTVLGASETQFQLYFRKGGHFSNNLFVDDITLITETVPPALKIQGYLILPTVFQNRFGVWHYQPPRSLRQVAVFNAGGQLVWSKQFSRNAPTFISVDLQGLSAGIYFVQLGYEDHPRNITQRIIKYP